MYFFAIIIRYRFSDPA